MLCEHTDVYAISMTGSACSICDRLGGENVNELQEQCQFCVSSSVCETGPPCTSGYCI